jgi:hypothetical protein
MAALLKEILIGSHLDFGDLTREILGYIGQGVVAVKTTLQD